MADKDKNVSESSESRNHVDESPLSTLFSNDTCYDMSHKNQGKVIVFSDSSPGALKFWNGRTFKNDVDSIQNTFGKKLGFDVKVYNDLSLWDIRKKVEELQKDDYSEDNCLVVFMLAPAAWYGYLKAQEEFFSVKSIWEQFTGDKCRSLAGKPKLFFIQASKEIAGLVETMDEVQMGKSDDPSKMIHYKIASYADFLIGHNSFDDYEFLPRVQKSSFYIQHLCDILDANSHKYDLLSIMATVTKEVGSDNCPIPSALSTLRKKVYFNR